MQIGNKLFPYPILNRTKNLSAYKTSDFYFDYEETDDETDFVLHNAHYVLKNDELRDLVTNGKAEVKLLVECSPTVFRENYTITEEPSDIRIPFGSLKDRVVISCFMYAKENITCFSSSDFLEDYAGYQFDIDKYSILAVDDGYTTRIEYDDTIDDKVSSIFLIISNEDTDVIKYRNQGTKIIIDVPSDAFTAYDTLKTNEYTRNIFFGLLAIPALPFMLQQVQMDMKINDSTLDDETVDYVWIESVRNAYKRINDNDLDDSTFLKADVEVLAQDLLNKSSSKALDDIFGIITEQQMEALIDE